MDAGRIEINAIELHRDVEDLGHLGRLSNRSRSYREHSWENYDRRQSRIRNKTTPHLFLKPLVVLLVRVLNGVRSFDENERSFEGGLMTGSAVTVRPRKSKNQPRELWVEAFWVFSSSRASLKDSERLKQIKEGFPAEIVQAFRLTFDL